MEIFQLFAAGCREISAEKFLRHKILQTRAKNAKPKFVLKVLTL